jgi:hypothetical protein
MYIQEKSCTSWNVQHLDLIVWQEGREGEERLMSATVKQRKTGVGEC